MLELLSGTARVIGFSQSEKSELSVFSMACLASSRNFCVVCAISELAERGRVVGVENRRWAGKRERVRLDLHRHLEGSHSAKALLRVARELGLTDPLFYDAQERRYRAEAEVARAMTVAGPSDDPAGFVAAISLARKAYVSVRAVGLLARAAFDEAAAETDGFELRISLYSMARTVLSAQGRRLSDVPEADFAALAAQALDAVLAARDAAATASGKPMLVRLGWTRNVDSRGHFLSLEPVVREQAARLSGQDLLGIVPGASPEPYPEDIMALIERLRGVLPDLTLHAGEFEGAASVERALSFGVQAIGHGVASVESRPVLDALAQRGVTLEVCPHSNALLIPSRLSALREAHHGQHPLVALQRHHVHAVLGSDDPSVMGTSFPDEWARAQAEGADLDRLQADARRRWRQLGQTC